MTLSHVYAIHARTHACNTSDEELNFQKLFCHLFAVVVVAAAAAVLVLPVHVCVVLALTTI